jgi:hypothetical protein
VTSRPDFDLRPDFASPPAPAALLRLELALAEHSLDPGDVLAGLAELAGVLQLLRDRLAPQVEQVLLPLGQLVLEVAGLFS